MSYKYSKKNKNNKKKSKKIYVGGQETTQGCNNCQENNPTPDELAWNNRYVIGKNTASGWGCSKGGKKSKKNKENKKKKIYKKIDQLFREYYKNKLNLND